MALQKLPNGYLRIAMRTRDGKKCYLLAHRVVAKAFIPNPLALRTVNHKNGIKTDNRASNLEWMTQSDNTLHSYNILMRCRRGPSGERNRTAKLTECEITKIISARNAGKTCADIAESHGVTAANIAYICRGDTWKHLGIKPTYKRPLKIDDRGKASLKHLRKQGFQLKELAAIFSISVPHAHRISKQP